MIESPVIAYGRWLAEVPARWPEAALESARRQFVDTVAVMIPGILEPASQRVLDSVRAWGTGPSTIIGAGACHRSPGRGPRFR